MMIKAINLNCVPHYFDDVFKSIYQEWGENNPNFQKSWIKSSMKSEGVPSTYVVLKDEQYVGTFSFWNCDLQSRQDLSLWLGGIVVVPFFRGLGIGLFIQKQVKNATERDQRYAYLFTEMTSSYEETG